MQTDSSPPLHRSTQRTGASTGVTLDPHTLRRALLIVPLAVMAYVLVWFCCFEPMQYAVAKPVVAKTGSQAGR